MPVVDKPLIQYAVEEAVAAGHDRDDLHHRPRQARASRTISTRPTSSRPSCSAARQDTSCSRWCRTSFPSNVTCIYVRQPEALGLGHAVLCARPVVGDEPFAVILADDLIDGEAAGPEADGRRLRARGTLRRSAVQNVPREETRRYGIVRHRRTGRSGLHRIGGIVEKPQAAKRAVHARRGRALHPDAAYLPSPAERIDARRRRRDPAHRRDRRAAARGARARVRVRGRALRLRLASSATCRRTSRSRCKHPEIGRASSGRWLRSD